MMIICSTHQHEEKTTYKREIKGKLFILREFFSLCQVLLNSNLLHLITFTGVQPTLGNKWFA